MEKVKPEINKKLKKSEEDDITENISKLVITKTIDKEIAEKVKESWKNNLVHFIIEEKCDLENIYTVLEEEKLSKSEIKKVHIDIANKLLEELEKLIIQKRTQSYRNISKSIRAMRQQHQASVKTKTTRKTKKKKPEEEKIKVEKVGLKDIGKEIALREEEERKLEELREKEQKEIQEERERFARTYQKVFELFAHQISVENNGNGEYEELIKHVKRLGSPNFTERQLAIDKLIEHQNLNLCYDALQTSLRDKNITLKTIQAFGKMGDFRIVKKLVNIMKENFQQKDSIIRGEAAAAIGNIVRILNKKEKSRGSKLMFRLLKAQEMESIISFLIPVIIKDLQDNSIRDKYYSKQCLLWLRMMARKMASVKKKMVSAASR